MKVLAILATVLFSLSAWTQTPVQIEEANQITCKGQTYEGDRYTVNVYYTLDPTWTQQNTPFTIVSGKRAFVSVNVERDGQVVYADALYTNDLMMKQTEDSRSFEFKNIEVQRTTNDDGELIFEDVTTDFVNISMVAEQPSEFDFELKTAYGDFENGRCSM